MKSVKMIRGVTPTQVKEMGGLQPKRPDTFGKKIS